MRIKYLIPLDNSSQVNKIHKSPPPPVETNHLWEEVSLDLILLTPFYGQTLLIDLILDLLVRNSKVKKGGGRGDRDKIELYLPVH